MALKQLEEIIASENEIETCQDFNSNPISSLKKIDLSKNRLSEFIFNSGNFNNCFWIDLSEN